MNQRALSPDTESAGAMILDLPTSRIMSNKYMYVVSKSPVPWSSVIAAERD